MVSTASWLSTHKVDLATLVGVCKGRFAPCVFPACIVRFRYPRATVSMFRTEKLVIAGARHELESVAVLNLLQLLLATKLGRAFPFFDFVPHNVVGSASLGFRVDLDRMFEENQSCCGYDPEQFAGLCWNVSDSACIVVFDTGSVIITGCPNKLAVDDMFDKMVPVLERYREAGGGAAAAAAAAAVTASEGGEGGV